jgi:hypothetical protein
LLTLSDRFIIALWTKPPMPLVGDDGRSVVFARRAWEEDMVNVLLRPACSPSVTDEVFSDIGEFFSWPSSAAMRDLRSGLLLVDERTVENAALEAVLFLTDPARDAVSELTLSEGAGLLALMGSVVVSRDMPGSPRLPDAKLSLDMESSLLLRYAALLKPLSAVCRNHEGSREPSEAAIWSREGSAPSEEAVDAGLLLSGSTIDLGLLPPPLELGRCCHDRVPDRASDDALCGCFGAEASPVVVDALSDEEPLNPNPLNSGMSFVGDSAIVPAGGAIDVESWRGSEASIAGAFVFSGLIDLARSEVPMLF